MKFARFCSVLECELFRRRRGITGKHSTQRRRYEYYGASQPPCQTQQRQSCTADGRSTSSSCAWGSCPAQSHLLRSQLPPLPLSARASSPPKGSSCPKRPPTPQPLAQCGHRILRKSELPHFGHWQRLSVMKPSWESSVTSGSGVSCGNALPLQHRLRC
jgi:hypothetical protein